MTIDNHSMRRLVRNLCLDFLTAAPRLNYFIALENHYWCDQTIKTGGYKEANKFSQAALGEIASKIGRPTTKAVAPKFMASLALKVRF